MKQYTTEKIRNVAILGHGGCGKTSLSEAMLYLAKATDRQGKVADGNTVSDFDAEEKKRGTSVSTSVLPLEWKDVKINLLDTPGMFDFTGEAAEGLRPAGTALICVSGKSGVNTGTRKAWKSAMRKNSSKAFFVSKMSEEHADFFKVHEQMKTVFGPCVCPIVLPAGDATYINLIDQKAFKYDGEGNATEIPMPYTLEHRLEGAMVSIYEAVAETDDELMEKYFSGETFTRDELVTGLRAGISSGKIAPIFCGDPMSLAAVDILLDSLSDYFYGPDNHPEITVDGKEVPADPTAPVSAFVFKTVADPFVGKLSYFKVASGVLKADMTLDNPRTGESEKIGKLMHIRGAKQVDADYIQCGDIGAVAKMASARTGDTLCAPGAGIQLAGIDFDRPCLSKAVSAKKKGEEEKITQGFQRLTEEDPTFSLRIDKETKQQVVSGMGEMHIDVMVSRLKTKFGVDVELSPVKVAYRETIRKKCKVQGRHKKQTGGHGQFGDVWIEFEPCDSDELVFEEKVFGGAVPRNFFPAVEKGLRDCTARGVLAGYPVVGVKAILVDGSYHPVDSSEMAFKTAASIAFKEGMKQASPTLLEPVGSLEVILPDDNMGDIMGDITKRRGRVLGMDRAEDGMQAISAEVPMAEMDDFAVTLRSVTRGMGSFQLDFARYEEAPQNIVDKVVAEADLKDEE